MVGTIDGNHVKRDNISATLEYVEINRRSQQAVQLVNLLQTHRDYEM